LSYGAGHMTVYGIAQAESELDQAIWFHTEPFPRLVLTELKKRRDSPATLACVRSDGSRTWGKEHPFFPVHDLTHCAVESVLGFDQAFFGLIAEGWDIDDFAKPRASKTMPFQAIVAEHVVGVFDRERALPAPMPSPEFNEMVSASLPP